MHETSTALCVVTGGSGFLGSYLLPVLSVQGTRTLALSHSSPVLGDPHTLADWLREVDARDIVHMAASSNPASGDARGFYEANAFLTETLLEGAARAKLAGRFVLLSATSVYGPAGDAPQVEDMPCRPLNHYGASKLLAEVIADWYRDRLDIVVARPSNCMGANQNPRYLVPKLVAAFVAREAELSVGDIDIARDFVDVRDAVDILARILLAPTPVPEVVNVSSGRATSIREILDTLAELTGHRPEVRLDERFIRAGDIRYQVCDTTRALSLGHVPKFQLRDTLDWMFKAALSTM